MTTASGWTGVAPSALDVRAGGLMHATTESPTAMPSIATREWIERFRLTYSMVAPDVTARLPLGRPPGVARGFFTLSAGREGGPNTRVGGAEHVSDMRHNADQW